MFITTWKKIINNFTYFTHMHILLNWGKMSIDFQKVQI
jgi:hypothetical protein